MEFQVARSFVKKTRRIQGWFGPGAAYLFALLDEIQKANGIEGNLFEIGVHHGKSTLLLGGMTDPAGECLGGCDLFAEQSSNVSGSGRGHYEIFLKNFEAVFPEHSFLRVFRKPSSDLTPAETTTRCRFFHIDGGHSAAETCGDLRTASEAVSENGVVVIDDLFNCAWPGVMDGVFQFMSDHRDTFQPVAIGFNKTVLARPPARPLYMEWFSDARKCWTHLPKGPFDLKMMEFCGQETAVFYAPTYNRRVHQRVLHRLYRKFPWLKNRFTEKLAPLLLR